MSRVKNFVNLLKGHIWAFLFVAVVFTVLLAGPLFSWLKSKNVPGANKLPDITKPPVVEQ